MRSRLAAAALLSAAVLAGCTTGNAAPAPPVVTESAPAGPFRGTELDPAQPRPTFTLTDTSG